MSAAPHTPPHVAVVRFFEARPWLTDTLFKVAPLALMATFIWLMGWNTYGFFGAEVHPGLMFLFEMLCVLPLAFSRSRPAVAAGVASFGALCQMLSFFGPGVSVIAVPLMVHACAKYGSRRVSVIYLLVGLMGAVLIGIHQAVTLWTSQPPGTTTYPDLAWLVPITILTTGFSAAVVLVAWLLGDLAGRRRRERHAVEEKNRLLERERDQEARLAADAERMRIAREMHDVVSHSMSVMIAQADGGRYVLSHDPARAGRAFETISETGREALTEMRRMLGVLRDEQDQLATRPAPGVEDLPGLIDDVRASGVEVQLHLAPLPPVVEGVGLALYRITQEALTNTLKHGGRDATAGVWLGTDPATAELVLDIRDTGQGAAAANDGAGSGLRGMAERAQLYSGRLTATPTEHGFAVHARFPLAAVSPQSPYGQEPR
ncbi:sensor histidine kinase [Nesterenkonia alba]|uniref:sensor histidine kinase n=1 Tax=Nesterenkonia alba TaxID=515814 RepID=UPI0003B72AF0|nr:histidine kinase [Nesterenkonia alba]